MDQKIPIKYRYAGKSFEAVERSWLDDNGIIFADDKKLYVSSRYYLLLTTNFEIAILEPVRLIRIDDQLLSMEDCRLALMFCMKEYNCVNNVTEKYKLSTCVSLINVQIRSMECTVEKNTSGGGNYTSHAFPNL